MCGIIGFLGYGRPVSARSGAASLALLAHRGPDDSGLLFFDRSCRPLPDADGATIALGHRRLSIIDLSPLGHQPMCCPRTGNVIVFNGEIYNFIEVRAQLEQQGATFTTRSDTEVILEAYRLWGERAFQAFNGMWAIILLDQARRQLVVSRDRLGVKPLYIARQNGVIGLASEIKPLVIGLDLPIKPNQDAVFDFLTAGISDHQTMTFFQGVEAVPPGSVLRLSLDGTVQQERYHEWPAETEQQAPTADGIRQILESSVLLRLRSDAPTVALVSGGLDSAIITSLAVTRGMHQPRTRFSGAFTYGYSTPEAQIWDETDRARDLVRSFGVELLHSVHKVDAKVDRDEILSVVKCQEQPFATPSHLAHYRMYKLIRESNFKVVLSGEGSDELMAGYTSQYLTRLARDSILGGRLFHAFTLMGSPHLSPRLLLNRMIWDLPTAILLPLLRRYRLSYGVIKPDFLDRMTGRLGFVRDFYRSSAAERVRRDILSTNLPQILRCADRNSMAHGVEARHPFLDYRYVELALRTPLDIKLSAQGGKLPLRQAFDGLLPADYAKAPKVTGFGHAEQFNFARLLEADFDPRDVPEAEEFIDLPGLQEGLRQTRVHPTAWLPVSLVLWLRDIKSWKTAPTMSMSS